MLKNISQIECKIGDKFYRLTCDIDSPLDHVKESLFQFLKYIGQIEDAVKAQQHKSEQSELPTEDHSVGIEPQSAE